MSRNSRRANSHGGALQQGACRKVPGQAAAFKRCTRAKGVRILAKGVEVSNDTWATGLNNNDLVIGPTGAGKTRHYVKPNLMQANESAIVTDTKGSLVEELGPFLEACGYRVLCIDFANMAKSFGYNPFDFVRMDKATGKPNEQDIMRISDALVPVEHKTDPFWDMTAKSLLNVFIGFILQAVREEDRNLSSVAKLLGHCKVKDGGSFGATERALNAFSAEHPDSFAARKWLAFRPTLGAERMYASILGILAEKLDTFTFDGVAGLFSAKERIDFRQLGQRKTVLFLNVSDTDRSLDRLVNLLYTQALQELCRFADGECPGHALPVPVRLYLDDFATNCVIPDFDKIVSVIRSRNIAVSVVLQSISQLDALYSHAQSMTIANACDHWLYLGGQDIETARMISEKASRALETVLNMGIRDAWLFERGSAPRKVQHYNICEHDRYAQLSEAGWEAEEALEPELV